MKTRKELLTEIKQLKKELHVMHLRAKSAEAIARAHGARIGNIEKIDSRRVQ